MNLYSFYNTMETGIQKLEYLPMFFRKQSNFIIIHFNLVSTHFRIITNFNQTIRCGPRFDSQQWESVESSIYNRICFSHCSFVSQKVRWVFVLVIKVRAHRRSAPHAPPASARRRANNGAARHAIICTRTIIITEQARITVVGGEVFWGSSCQSVGLQLPNWCRI